MKRLLLLFCALAAVAATAVAVPAMTVVVNFDDVIGSGMVQDGYGGVNGNDWWWRASSSGYYTAHSGTNFAYTPLAYFYFNLSPASSFTGLEVLQGVFFSGPPAGSGNPGISAQFIMHLGNAEAVSSVLLPINSTLAWLALAYPDKVDNAEVVAFYIGATTQMPPGFSATGDPPATGAPAPPALLLLASGLTGLAAARKRLQTRGHAASLCSTQRQIAL
ncbi:MAG: hypothetical protein ABSC19_19440 [Syntrophorhabdales bacterium]|jgi:hypothetical protein